MFSANVHCVVQKPGRLNSAPGYLFRHKEIQTGNWVSKRFRPFIKRPLHTGLVSGEYLSFYAAKNISGGLLFVRIKQIIRKPAQTQLRIFAMGPSLRSPLPRNRRNLRQLSRPRCAATFSWRGKCIGKPRRLTRKTPRIRRCC